MIHMFHNVHRSPAEAPPAPTPPGEPAAATAPCQERMSLA